MMTATSADAALLHVAGVPNPRQALFFASKAKYTAYGGARGGGKSWALRRKLVGLCLCYPGIRCLLLRRTLPELKANHIRPMLMEYGGVTSSLLRWNAGESAFLFRNGSRIEAGFCDCERDLLRYQGQEYDIIAIDEATQLTENQFAVFKACLRGVRDFPRRMYLTCNPGGVGHAWVKRLFIDREYRAGEEASDYNFIPARVYDNTVLTEADPDYVRQLQSLPERLRSAWLDGRWDVFEGQFFPEFDEARHVLPVSPEPSGLLFGAMDYGFDRLAVLFLSEAPDGRLYVLDERCASGLTLGEAASTVAGMFKDLPVEYVVASPDLWNRRQDSGRSGVSVMENTAALPPFLRADDRRIPGWRVLREYLHGDKDTPGLQIAPQCRELISCMQALQCNPRVAEDAAGEPHAVTHAPEALRYAVMSRHGGRTAVEDQQKENEKMKHDFRFGKNCCFWE